MFGRRAFLKLCLLTLAAIAASNPPPIFRLFLPVVRGARRLVWGGDKWDEAVWG